MIGQGLWVRVVARVAAMAVVVLGLAQPAAGQAGAAAYIQLEALPDAATASARAAAYGQVPGLAGMGVKGFRAGQSWHVLVLGPFAAEDAAGRMAALKSAGQIPSDAYITDGSSHGVQFWPQGADGVGAGAGAGQDQAEAVLVQDPMPSAPPEADQTLAQAQAGEAQLARADKAEMQQALQWYGHYSGALDGALGRGSRAAMAEWQGQMGYAVTGVLTRLQRETLLANFRADSAAYGFAPVEDSEAGVAMTLPSPLLQFDHYAPPFAHYAAKDGSALHLAVISEPGDAPQLQMLYDLLQTLPSMPTGGARSFGEGSFTLNGQSETLASFATASASKGAIKGYLLTWAPEQADQAQRILATLSASFRSTGAQVLDPGLVPLDESLKAGVLAGMAQAVPLRAASGLYVTPDGQVLTDARAAQGCGRITLDGGVAAQVVGQSAELGAALLRPDAPLAPRAVARLAAAAPAIGAKVLLAGYSLPSGLPAPVLTDAQVAAATGPAGEAGFVTLDAPVTPLDMGGPVLNRAGQVLGIILGDGLQGKRLPQGLSLARDMAQIAPWLAGLVALSAPEAAAGDLPPDTLNAAAMGMTVQVLCWP